MNGEITVRVTLPGDEITMLPGIPNLGTPEFDAWLTDWNEVHNPKRTVEVMA